MCGIENKKLISTHLLIIRVWRSLCDLPIAQGNIYLLKSPSQLKEKCKNVVSVISNMGWCFYFQKLNSNKNQKVLLTNIKIIDLVQHLCFID